MKFKITSLLSRFLPFRAVLIALLAASLSFGPALAQEKAPAQQAKPEEKEKPDYKKSSKYVFAAFRDTVARPSQSTVRVQYEGKDAALGAIVGSDGWVLTKASELKGSPVCKLKDGRTLEARVVGVHEPSDLMLLKIDAGNLPAVEWSESKTAPVGNWVASPSTGEDPVAVGVVSVAARKVPPRFVPNMSGGFLGVSMEPAASNVKIVLVQPGSGAEKAGLKVNDVVLSVAGKPVSTPEAMSSILGKMKPGEEVVLKIKRADKEMELKATLGKRPLDRSAMQNQIGGPLSERRTGFATVLQHDSVLKPSDCGGPVVDLDGKVIGINIARAGRTETHALPSEVVLPLMYDLMSGKLAPKNVPAKTVTAASALADAEAALKKVQTELADAYKKLAEAKSALEKLDAQSKAADNKSDAKPDQAQSKK